MPDKKSSSGRRMRGSIPYYYPRDARKAARVCPGRKVYPDHKIGHWLMILGVLMLFMFAPVWIWVIGIGVGLILVGMHFMSKE